MAWKAFANKKQYSWQSKAAGVAWVKKTIVAKINEEI